MIIGMNGWSFSINVDWCTLTCGLYSHSELSFLKMRWLAFIFHLKWGDRLQREDRNIPSAEKLYLFAQCLVLFWVAIIPIFLNEFKYIKGTYLAVHPVERCANATCFCNYLIVAYHLRFIYIYISIRLSQHIPPNKLFPISCPFSSAFIIPNFLHSLWR